jgi:hypothetical protein
VRPAPTDLTRATNNSERTSSSLSSICGVVRLEVAVDGWHWSCAFDTPPTPGELRDFAQTVAGVTGRDPADALAAVLDGFDAPPAPTMECAA